MHTIMHNAKLKSTEILEVCLFCLYLLIHVINEVVKITEYFFNEYK